MKLLIFSDLHLHNHAPFAEPAWSGINSRGRECIQVLYRLEDVVRDDGVDAVLFCGDFWDFRGYLWVPLFDMAYRALTRIASRVPFVMISGNHDLATSDRHGISGIDAFRNIPGVRVLVPPFGKNLGGVMVYGMGADKTMLDLEHISSSPNNLNILMLHETIKGVKMTDQYSAPLGLSPIELGRFMDRKDIHRCFLGDIHLRQDPMPNVHYVGCCLQKSFSDSGQDKGFTLYDTDEDTLTFISSRAPKFYVTKKMPLEENKNYWRVTPDSYPEYKAEKFRKAKNVQLIPPVKEHKKRSNIDLTTNSERRLKEYVHIMEPDVGKHERLLDFGKSFFIESKT